MPVYDSYLYGGYGFDTLSPYGWFGRSPGYAQPADEPKEPAKPKEGLVATTTGQSGASIAAMSNAGSGFGGYPGYGNRRPVTVETIIEALRDPVISNCHAYIAGPICAGKANLVATDEAPEGAKEWIEKATKPLLPRYLKDAVWCIPFGWAGWQKEFERRDGDFYVKLHACRQEWSGVLYHKETGAHIGLRWDGTDIFGRRQFIITHNPRGSKDYLGRSRIENVQKAIDDWIAENDQTAKLANKASGMLFRQGYPPGPNGDTTNKSKAEEFAKRATSGASWITYPTWGGFTIEEITRLSPEQLVAFAKATDWPSEAMDLRDQGAAISALTTDKQYLDQLKCLGYGVPPQAVLSGSTSNRATSEAAGGFGTAMNEIVNRDVYAVFNEHVVDDLMELKYGPKTRGTVRWEPEPLEDPQELFDRQIIQAAFSSSNPDVQRAIGERDIGAICDRNGLPRKPQEQIDAEKAEAEEQAEKQFDQQRQMMEHKAALGAKPTNGKPVNGEAKDKITLSAEQVAGLIEERQRRTVKRIERDENGRMSAIHEEEV